ncbi:flavodoxin [Jeotgalibaca sp. MA1X17-3]|uniref:flavodoxin n=1 Tax=Jeotgalibaca sp. MA1X17-3 TaxID=2908211 RepID=UPI001F1ECB5E|nr:flavodoxin [Jeotgalibaca sp. MA1X17-3]UJF15331.1 flavodoxin [Jeotgalibaca sp. MA1X17-3]
MAQALIVFASLTGNTEEIADITAELLEEKGVDVDVVDCVQSDPIDFEGYDYCIVGSYTYGVDGDLPDEIMDFFDELEEVDLTGKVFGVVGSGDTFYEQFCTAVDDFEVQFAKTGATKGATGVKVDLNAEEEDIENLKKFVNSMVDTHASMTNS